MRTIENIPSGTNLRDITKLFTNRLASVGFGLFVFSLMVLNEMAETYEDFRARKAWRIGRTLRYGKSFKAIYLRFLLSDPNRMIRKPMCVSQAELYSYST